MSTADSGFPAHKADAEEDARLTTRRNWFKLAGVGAALTVLSATDIKTASATTSSDLGLVNVKDYGATGNGITPDQRAFQAAVDFATANNMGGIYMPPGRYLLTAPVEVDGSFTVVGFGGDDFGGSQGSVVLPATVAFRPRSAAVLQHLIGFTCKNIVFSGGTIPIDLGLRHECVFRDLTFINPYIAAISIVQGERHEFRNIRIYAQSVDCQYGLALACKTITTLSALGGFNFGAEGTWLDRVTVDKLVFMFGPASYVRNGIYCEGILSNFNSQHVVCHGLRGYALYIGNRLQFSHIANYTMDACETAGALISINHSLWNVLIDVSPGSAGNNRYLTGIELTGFSDNTVFINCNAPGNNAARYGFKFANAVGQTITLIGCSGALYHGSVTSALQQNRITQMSCFWTASTTSGSAALSSTDNRDITLQLMADVNGASKATNSVKIVAAFGENTGTSQTIFEASLQTVAIGNGLYDMPVKFGNRYEWYDSRGNKRAKVGKPNSESDGVIISSAPVL